MEISIPEGVSTDEAGFPVLLFVVVCKFCACGSFSRALMWMKIKLKTSLVFGPEGRQTWWRWACPSSACRPQCLGQLVSPAPVIVTLQGAIQVTKSSCLLFCWFRIKRPGRLPVGWSPSCSALVPLHQSLLPPAWYMQNIALSHSKWIPWHCPWAVWRVWYWHPLQAVPAKSLLASPPAPGWESVQHIKNLKWISFPGFTSSSMIVALPRLLRALVIFLPRSASTILLADQNSAMSCFVFLTI